MIKDRDKALEKMGSLENAMEKFEEYASYEKFSPNKVYQTIWIATRKVYYLILLRI